MNFLRKFFYTENIKIKIFLISSFLISWLSLGSSFEDLILNINNQEKNLFYEIINFVRTFLNILSFVLLSFFYLKNFKKINYKNFINIYLIFAVYLALQIPGLFFTPNIYDNLYFILSSLNIVIILYLADKFFKYEEIKIFIYISVLVMSLILLFTYLNHSYQYFTGARRLFYGNPLVILENSPIRSSGAGRLGLMVLIFFLLIFLSSDKKKILRIFVVSFLSMIVLIYQSRANIALWGIFIILYLYFLKDFSLKKIVELLFSFLIIPIFIISILPILKSFIFTNIFEILQNDQHVLYSTFGFFSSTLDFDLKILEKESQQREIFRNMRGDTSGRLEDWVSLLNNFNYNDNLFFGYGSQGDRYLINQTASNGFIYAFASSGIIGLIFYIIFNLMIFINMVKHFFYKRINDQIIFSCLIVIILLLLRSLIESSFAVFGVDFILILMSGFIINKKLNN